MFVRLDRPHPRYAQRVHGPTAFATAILGATEGEADVMVVWAQTTTL
jgi:hypothetical protein